MIAATRQIMFRKMCDAIGLPQLPTHPLFTGLADRVTNQIALKAEIEAVLMTDDTAVWDAKLLAVGVPCGALRTIEDLLEDGQLRERKHAALQW